MGSSPASDPAAASHAANHAASLFAALGDVTRLHVVARLCEQGPLSITRLTDGAGVSRQAVSKHLRVLADAGLVSSHRSGREHHWQLEPDRLREARHYLDVIEQDWDLRLSALRDFVER